MTEANDAPAVVIKVFDDGPLHVVGDFEIVDADGNAFPKRALFSFCRCGLSERKPYCDGAHREKRFASKCRATKPVAAETQSDI